MCKFGTSLEQIEELRSRLLSFVESEKREYQPKIITELRDIPDMHSVKLNVIFFYKSNWQNELVRLQRRNKLMCALMVSVAEVGIESPNMRWPGQKSTQPVWLQSVNADQMQQSVLDRGTGPERPDADYKPFIPGASPSGSILRSNSRTSDMVGTGSLNRNTSLNRSTSRGSAYGQSKKVDFSLGVKDMVSSDVSGDVFEDRRKMQRAPMVRVLEEREREEEEAVLARSTSRASAEHGSGFMRRHRAGSGSIMSHRNRFLGNSVDAPDLETGTLGKEGHHGRPSGEMSRAGPSNRQPASVKGVEDVESKWL